MSDKQRLTALIKFLKAASPEVIAEHIALAEEKQGASFEFSKAAEKTSAPRPADAPPLWAERKAGWNKPTGQKTSPVLWIKMHYGNKDVDNWDSMGLTRKDLLYFDSKLYYAYSQWIGRHENETLKLKTRSEVLNDKAEKFGLLGSPESEEIFRVANAIRLRAHRQPKA